MHNVVRPLFWVSVLFNRNLQTMMPFVHLLVQNQDDIIYEFNNLVSSPVLHYASAHTLIHLCLGLGLLMENLLRLGSPVRQVSRLARRASLRPTRPSPPGVPQRMRQSSQCFAIAHCKVLGEPMVAFVPVPTGVPTAQPVGHGRPEGDFQAAQGACELEEEDPRPSLLVRVLTTPGRGTDEQMKQQPPPDTLMRSTCRPSFQFSGFPT